MYITLVINNFIVVIIATCYINGKILRACALSNNLQRLESILYIYLKTSMLLKHPQAVPHFFRF